MSEHVTKYLAPALLGVVAGLVGSLTNMTISNNSRLHALEDTATRVEKKLDAIFEQLNIEQE